MKEEKRKWRKKRVLLGALVLLLVHPIFFVNSKITLRRRYMSSWLIHMFKLNLWIKLIRMVCTDQLDPYDSYGSTWMKDIFVHSLKMLGAPSIIQEKKGKVARNNRQLAYGLYMTQFNSRARLSRKECLVIYDLSVFFPNC